MSVCSIPGCGKPARARGWCNTHWRRWRRHGDPTVVILSGWRKTQPDPEPPGLYTWSVRYTRTTLHRVTYTVSCGDCGDTLGQWLKPNRGDWMADRMLGAWWAHLPPHTCQKKETA